MVIQDNYLKINSKNKNSIIPSPTEKQVKTLPINNGLLDFGTLPNSLYIVHVYDSQGNHLTTVKHLLSK